MNECLACGAEIDPDDDDGVCDACDAPHPLHGGSEDDEAKDIEE